MDFRDKMKMLRIQQGLTLEAVGKIVGVGKSTVRKWESGQIANMGRDKIALLAKALNVSPGYLMGWESEVIEKAPSSLPHPSLIPIHKKRVRMLGKIAAGQPIYADEDHEAYVPVDGDLECDFALEVDGDSMSPRFLEKDIVYFREQPDVNDSQIAAVVIDDTATLKHVYHIPNGIQLVSDNPKYPPMTFDAANSTFVRILGLAVGYYRRIN